MQISQLKKLLRPIKELTSRRAKRSSAETLELREENKVQSCDEVQNSECKMQNEVSRQKQLGVVFDVANAQKQGVADAECTEAEDTTMFQESEQVQSDETISAQADSCSEDMPTEAEPTPETPSPTVNTKAHLSSSVPRAARLPQGALTKGQMAEIREIFGDIDDAEIQRLYKRVTK
jgi:hypothetical protein